MHKAIDLQIAEDFHKVFEAILNNLVWWVKNYVSYKIIESKNTVRKIIWNFVFNDWLTFFISSTPDKYMQKLSYSQIKYKQDNKIQAPDND